jgi:hypothetical protein
MHSGPSKTAEAIVAVLVPPASREEVLGDLHELRSADSADPGLRFIHFVPGRGLAPRSRTLTGPVGTAAPRDSGNHGDPWLDHRRHLCESGQRSAPSLARGPVVGLLCAMASQEMFWIGGADFALPRWVMIYGCSMSLLLSCAVRVWFPPITGLLHGAKAPADWLGRAVGWPESMLGSIRVLKGVFVVVTVAMIGTRTIAHSPSSKLRIVPVLLVLWIAYQIWKRG